MMIGGQRAFLVNIRVKCSEMWEEENRMREIEQLSLYDSLSKI